MLIKHSKGRPVEPINFSEYNRTHNHAIDLVAQAVGWAKKYSIRPLAAIALKPSKHMLFVKGMEVLAGREFSTAEVEGLTFEGVKILKGSLGQIDSMRMEYVENVINIPAPRGKN